MILNINNDAVVAFTNTLEKMHRSALPNAVRGTLNRCVFYVKNTSLPQSANAAFTNRQPNFFRANSRFENAKGFNLASMKATVGMTEGSLKGQHNYAVEDLQQQEHGGVIQRKSFIPLPGARINKSLQKNVRANARLSAIKKIVDSRKMPGKGSREKFVHAILEAGKGGYVLSGTVLWRINSTKKTGRFFKDKTAMYSFRRGRSVRVPQTSFMKKASTIQPGKMEDFYQAEMKRQIEKLK